MDADVLLAEGNLELEGAVVIEEQGAAAKDLLDDGGVGGVLEQFHVPEGLRRIGALEPGAAVAHFIQGARFGAQPLQEFLHDRDDRALAVPDAPGRLDQVDEGGEELLEVADAAVGDLESSPALLEHRAVRDDLLRLSIAERQLHHRLPGPGRVSRRARLRRLTVRVSDDFGAGKDVRDDPGPVVGRAGRRTEDSQVI